LEDQEEDSFLNTRGFSGNGFVRGNVIEKTFCESGAKGGVGAARESKGGSTTKPGGHVSCEKPE